MTLFGHIAYLSVIVLLLTSIPLHQMGEARGALLVIGAIGIWRHGWAAVNYSRAAYFLKVAHPRRRRTLEAAFAREPVPPHAFFMVTSYKIDPAVTAPVYQSIFRAAAAAPGGATVVASVVETADNRLIRRLFEQMPPPARAGVTLIVDQIPGSGKRDAIARSLELIRARSPSRRDIIAFVDGDSSVPEDLVARTAPVFCDPRIGACTTDEAVEIAQPGLFRDWFDLRFAQRHIMMSSMGLSKRVLTLTGRMSVFRADLASDQSFIDMVRADSIRHWRLGEVRFLTGDDKSTWFWLLKNGYQMAYLPDVSSVSMESQPRKSFVASAVVLMTRWYGNMLRTNGRSLVLGPKRIGFFTWWSVLDQRTSIWTTLAGPTGILLTALLIEPLVLPAYIAWVMGTRYFYCALLSLVRGRLFPISYPFLLYFGQIVGALVKSYVLFRLDIQKWTRQSGSGRLAPANGLSRFRSASSVYLHALTFGWLLVGVMYLTQIV
ncbi:MAG: glycosyltransferase [Pseudomonadota bacterium]